MDEGRLTDSTGKRVDFRNALLILTSNLGADALAALPEGLPSPRRPRDAAPRATPARRHPSVAAEPRARGCRSGSDRAAAG